MKLNRATLGGKQAYVIGHPKMAILPIIVGSEEVQNKEAPQKTNNFTILIP